MPLQETPKFNGTAYNTYVIKEPASGGLNLQDLEFDMFDEQSPDMLNVMYRNGVFSKRYSLEYTARNIIAGGADIKASIYYMGYLIVQADDHIIAIDLVSKNTLINDFAVSAKPGFFSIFMGRVYFINEDHYSVLYIKSGMENAEIEKVQKNGYRTYDMGNGLRAVYGDVVPYIPKVFINRDAKAGKDNLTVTDSESRDKKESAGEKVIWGGDKTEEYNMIGRKFEIHFNGDGVTYKYYSPEFNSLGTYCKVTVGPKEISSADYDYDSKYGLVTFHKGLEAKEEYKDDYGNVLFKQAKNGSTVVGSAPVEGVNNVYIQYEFSETDEESIRKNRAIKLNKFSINFGGDNNSRLFLGGGGDSTLYYSWASDATYFPDDCYMTIGNSEDDITGFGLQYNVMIVFKPREIYSVSYYIQTANTTADENQIGIGAFKCQIVNTTRGCDCPYTIQTINNQLTWHSTIYGVQTLTSTYLVDERNVRPISRNVNRANRFRKGILDWNPESRNNIISIDYDQKYFLINSETGEAFVWDYGMSPYQNTGRIDDDAKRLSWFYFDNFFFKSIFNVEDKAMFIPYRMRRYILENGKVNRDFADIKNAIGELGLGFEDYAENAIDIYYMTPLLHFSVAQGSGSRNSVENLKTIKNIYVEARGDTASLIRMRYITDEDGAGEEEPEPLIIPSHLWYTFSWDTFLWKMIRFSNTFRRKCSIKKVQLMGVIFYQNIDGKIQHNRDMSISEIVMQYQNVKNIK